MPCQRLSSPFLRVGRHMIIITPSMMGRSMTRLELMPFRMVFSAGMAKGEMVMAVPLTRMMLNRLAPITLPRDREPWPFTRLVMAVMSSGRLVPRATMVRPMTESGTPRAAAILVPLSTRNRAPMAMATAPTTSSSSSCHRVFALPPASSSSSSSASSGCFFICMVDTII